jgi:S1-C subfamily serine protease
MGRQVSEQTLPVPLGLQARPDGPVLRVAGVSSGSRAERTGLRGGDSIIAINGVPVAEIPMAELRAHIGASPLTLTVERDGKTLELAVPDR